MFDLLDRPLLWIPVTWPALLPPEQEGDLARPGEYTIEIQVELIDMDEAVKLFPPMFPGRDAEAAEAADAAPEIWSLKAFKRLVKDWRKISSHGKASPPLNDKNIRLLLKAPMFIVAFATAYITALSGRAEVREKNSASSPDVGRADTESEPTISSNSTASASA